MKKLYEKRVSKEDLYLLKEHSSVESEELQHLVEQECSVSSNEWRTFIEYFLLTLGSGLLVSGIVFFFAYNWNDMPAFGKFAVVLGLLVVAVYCSVTNRMTESTRKVSLVIASVLVGVLFAVFGQVYQTGANAYDLFLVWTITIIPWTVVSKFSVQWLGLVVLVNTTFSLFFSQVSTELNFYMVLSLFLSFNITLFVLPFLIGRMQGFVPSKYYTAIMAFVCTCIAVFSISAWIFTISSNYDINDLMGESIAVILSCVWIGASYYWSVKQRNILFFSYFGLAVVSILFMLLLKWFKLEIVSLLLYTIYIIGATYGLIKVIMHMKKTWKDERE
ncbi:DUF2157 domain-containing protein [Myroides sp. BIT-d1]|uniref:DUF2157 domain-containing protein n=1 Tax=Myroides albus TaxID=2562892 RepID=A0A6I3LH14_9FLAO|nr:DUF2157 domain-containing protein [Myroides albus]MTG98859.1 DUF2157 domain-containing protein [Myroides albus]